MNIAKTHTAAAAATARPSSARQEEEVVLVGKVGDGGGGNASTGSSLRLPAAIQGVQIETCNSAAVAILRDLSLPRQNRAGRGTYEIKSRNTSATLYFCHF